LVQVLSSRNGDWQSPPVNRSLAKRRAEKIKARNLSKVSNVAVPIAKSGARDFNRLIIKPTGIQQMGGVKWEV